MIDSVALTVAEPTHDPKLGAARKIENCWLYVLRGDVPKEQYDIIFEAVLVTHGKARTTSELAQERWRVAYDARREILPGDHLVLQDCEPALAAVEQASRHSTAA